MSIFRSTFGSFRTSRTDYGPALGSNSSAKHMWQLQDFRDHDDIVAIVVILVVIMLVIAITVCKILSLPAPEGNVRLHISLNLRQRFSRVARCFNSATTRLQDYSNETKPNRLSTCSSTSFTMTQYQLVPDCEEPLRHDQPYRQMEKKATMIVSGTPVEPVFSGNHHREEFI